MSNHISTSLLQQKILKKHDEDIALLLDKSNLKTLDYYNIAQTERLVLLKAYWPLLDELVLTKEKSLS